MQRRELTVSGAVRATYQQADALGGLPRECRLSATRADLRWNMLYQHVPTIHIQHFAHELVPGGFAAESRPLNTGELNVVGRIRIDEIGWIQ